MKPSPFSILAAAFATTLLLAAITTSAQQAGSELVRVTTPAPGKKPKLMPGTLVVPTSSRINTADKGKRAHTNVRFIMPATASPLEAPPYPGYGYETPASLACLYHLVVPIAGCNPNLTVKDATGGSQSIAIVDAYDNPEAAPDLAYFSDVFGLPFSPSKFHVVYQSGNIPPPIDITGSWELEESLDIEYAHAMAPNAVLYLVEANSNYYSDLYASVTIATNLVQCGKTTTCPTTATGKGEVTMSWGGEEYSSETANDALFTGKNVVYFASSGDSPGTSYPCVSPNIVCAGGTTTARGLATGNLLQEISWADGGGGLSLYEPIPTYQAALASTLGKFRGVPDLSSDANPYTGVWVYDSFPMDLQFEGNWWIVGGTSASSPTLAGIVNAAGHFAASSTAELTTIYANRAVATDFNDITYGYCGPYSGYLSSTGWDFCTGVGSPYGLVGK